MVDLFEEVEDELRNEQYKKLALKLAPWVVGGLIAGVLVAAAAYGYIRYQEATIAKAAGAYASALDTLMKGDQQGADKQLDAIPGSSKGYKTLALMLQASLRLDAGKTAEAVKLFDQAADTAPSGPNGLIFSRHSPLESGMGRHGRQPLCRGRKALETLDGRRAALARPGA